MHTPLFLALTLLLTAAAYADEPAPPPATPPAPPTTQQTVGLDATITIHTADTTTASITLTNNTPKPLPFGHFDAYSFTRTDTTPPTVVAQSPPNAMHPMFRQMIPPGGSQTANMTLSDKPLPPGHYKFTIAYPVSVHPTPLVSEFDIPAPTKKP
ncbi:MAG: hypothetical protein ACTHN5_23895 [Phycisphaerae bacterium]